MMGFFKKNKKIDKDKSYIEIKDAINKINGSITKKEKVIANLKIKAKKALAEKNEKLAKLHLTKKIKQEKNLETLFKVQIKLSEQMDAIEQSETIQIASEALSNAVKVLNQYAKIIEDLKIDEIIADSEESIAIIEDASEMIGDTTIDILEDDQLSQELDELQAEVALEMSSELALAPDAGGKEPVLVEQDITETSTDDVKKELEKLKKELDMG
ncbi:MAG: Snf7 family protein [Candidatus Hodarchaeota archaeon]